MKHTILTEKPLPRFPINLTTVSLSWLAIAMLTQPIVADGVASYSYHQDNLDTSLQPVVHANSVGPVPIPLSVTEQTPNSSYVFDVSGFQTSPTSLATRASLIVDVNQLGKPEFWSSSQAHAEAEASLADFATVQGPIGATSGTIVFSWVVSGAATLSLDTSNFNIVQVLDLSTSATLKSTIPNSMGPLIDVSSEYPLAISSNEMWQHGEVIDSGVLTFDVPWQNGVEMPVFFDLNSTVNLDTSNLDASGFKAGLDIDLANTAVLSGVTVLDESGAAIPDAHLVSRDGFIYPSVPEPGASLLFAIGTIVVQLRARYSRIDKQVARQFSS